MAHAADSAGFSLTNCGPVDRALVRAGLESGEPPRLFVRAFLPALAIWLPMLVLAFLRPGDGAGAEVSFFEDLTTHVRFLVLVPLLLIAEAPIGRRTRHVAAQFPEAGMLTRADRPRFEALLRQARKGVESTFSEAVIGALAAVLVVTAFRTLLADDVTMWFERARAEGIANLTAAGWWYAIGAWLPPFLLLRWAWRYLVWCWLLLRWSRLDLQAIATHPDRTGGLSFVSLGHTAFTVVGFAMSCLVAAAVATRVLHEGASLASFELPLAVFVALSIVVGIAPLLVFWKPLRIAKERGLRDYGGFASRYVQQFHGRWVNGSKGEQPFDARDDIGPLADIGASYERVDNMRLVPVTLKTALTFAIATVLPMLPLLLTVMPFRELLKLLMRAMI